MSGDNINSKGRLYRPELDEKVEIHVGLEGDEYAGYWPELIIKFSDGTTVDLDLVDKATVDSLVVALIMARKAAGPGFDQVKDTIDDVEKYEDEINLTAKLEGEFDIKSELEPEQEFDFEGDGE